MVDFLLKKRHVFITVLKHRQASAPWIADGPRRNMTKSMAVFLEKPTILFAMFVYLGINTLSNIATKLSFLEGRSPERA
jgi:hypothetical protein